MLYAVSVLLMLWGTSLFTKGICPILVNLVWDFPEIVWGGVLFFNPSVFIHLFVLSTFSINVLGLDGYMYCFSTADTSLPIYSFQ